MLTITVSNPIDDTGVKTFYAFEELDHHLAIPRSFLSPAQLRNLKLEVEDLRPLNAAPPFPHTIVARDDSQKLAMTALDGLCDGGILEMGCGNGKTVMALYFAATRGLPTMIIVNSTSLLTQWQNEIRTHLEMEPGIVRGEKEEFWNMTIATIQTLALRDYPKDVLDEYGTVIFDECHHLSAPTFNTVCPMFTGVRLGLTATKRREDGLEGLYLHHLGPVVYSDLSTKLQPTVTFLRTGVTISAQERENVDVNGMVNVSLLRRWLSEQEYRNALILHEVFEARKKGRSILVLGHMVEHLTYLHSQVPNSGLYTGKVSLKKRDEILKNADVIFATTKLAAEGLDEPRLDTLLIITPFKSTNLFQQALGRILRPFEGKAKPVAIIFEDRIIQCIGMTNELKNWLRGKGIPFKVEEL